MSNVFGEIMSDQSDKALIKILTFEREQFQPEALLAAQEELKKRNLTVARFDTLSFEIEVELKKDAAKANEPLGVFWKLLAFLFPGIITLAFSGTFRSEGFERKAKELFRWTLYGFCFYISLITLAMIINRLSD